jgi:transcriptional regulator with XRE-family HTH domain
MPTVGERIREIREEMQINQEQLAERSGLSKGFLSDVENNKRNIGSENLLKIANVLGASVDYLLRGDTTKQPRNWNSPTRPRWNYLRPIGRLSRDEAVGEYASSRLRIGKTCTRR